MPSIQVVMGPAGSGKSTYCHLLQEHCVSKMAGGGNAPALHVANLDPAAENFLYEPVFDIRDLISVTEVMEELGLGPNGALLYCMEYLLENMDWLHDEIEKYDNDDDYLLLDCPGQIELYTHVPIQKRILDVIGSWGICTGKMVSVFCIDATFCIDANKFLSGSLLSLSAMIALELPHVTIMTKCDLMDEQELDRILNYGSATHIWNLEQDRQSLLLLTTTDNATANYADMDQATTTTTTTRDRDNNRTTSDNDDDDNDVNPDSNSEEIQRLRQLEQRRLHRNKLSLSISQILDDYQMVSFIPLNYKDEDSLEHVFATVNHCIGYGEDLDVRGADANNDDYDGPPADDDPGEE